MSGSSPGISQYICQLVQVYSTVLTPFADGWIVLTPILILIRYCSSGADPGFGNGGRGGQDFKRSA